ncbi:MAG TPA: rhomboid family intramembrane serine protease [Jatrophihabitans sp.]|nr:rhomboid family intramembrane serine protease [Jatrophihabitans sp.]
MKSGRASIRTARTVVGARADAAALPYVTYALIAINVLVYLLTALGSGANLVQNNGQVQARLELIPYLVAADHDYYRLVTAMFVHYGPIHILFNMYALWVIGPALERAFGRWRFAAVYLIAGLGGSVACLLFQNPLAATAGASGAIFGLFAALLVLSKRTGTPATQVWIIVGINFVFTFSVPNISIWGHLGGFVVGGLATLALLAWKLRQQFQLPDVRVQLAGLAALVVLLTGATFVRAEQLNANPPRQSVSYSP